MITRLVRDVLVGSVWAGALTALVLDSVLVGLLLVTAGLLQLVHLRLVPSGSLFGAGSPPTTAVPRRWAHRGWASRLVPRPATRLVPRPGAQR